MRVIEKGKLPEDIVYSMKCRKCHSLTLFEYKEGRLVYDARDGNAIVFECPTCHQEMWTNSVGNAPTSW